MMVKITITDVQVQPLPAELIIVLITVSRDIAHSLVNGTKMEIVGSLSVERDCWKLQPRITEMRQLLPHDWRRNWRRGNVNWGLVRHDEVKMRAHGHALVHEHKKE